MNQQEGVHTAGRFKELLLKRGYPIEQVILFGSVAKDAAHAESDIDIAVITKPFHESRIEEGTDILLLGKEIDVRIETVTLHEDDFKRPFFGLGKEIKEYGVPV